MADFANSALKLNDPARCRRELQPERDGRVRFSTWLGAVVVE